MTDRFQKFPPILNGPFFDGTAVTTSNTSIITCRALYIGTGGNVSVQMLGYDNSNTVLSFANVPSGTTLDIRVTKVLTNTTATDIIALF